MRRRSALPKPDSRRSGPIVFCPLQTDKLERIRHRDHIIGQRLIRYMTFLSTPSTRSRSLNSAPCRTICRQARVEPAEKLFHLAGPDPSASFALYFPLWTANGEDVEFEVWNEWNYPGFWSGGTEAQYYQLYQNCRRGGEERRFPDPDRRPATNLIGPTAGICKLLNTNNVKIRFFDNHDYGGGGSGPSADPVSIRNDNRTRRTRLKAAVKNCCH